MARPDDEFKAADKKLAIVRLQRRVRGLLKSWLFHAALCVLLWLCVGTLFYRYYLKWKISAAFYFAVQAGLSVGFGAEEYNLTNKGINADGASRWFTVFFVLIGSSGVAATLAAFVQGVIEKQDFYYEDEMELASKSRRRHRRNESEWKIVMFLKRFQTAFVSLGVFSLWLLFGLLYGMFYEKWSLSESLLFSMTALSTGGLIAPQSSDTACWFTAFYVLTGVPLYGFVLGQLAGAIVERHARQKFKHQLSRRITKAEFEYAASLDSVDDEVDWGEFLQMSLLRLGKLNRAQCQRIRNRFNLLDVDGNGKFSRKEMQVALAFDRWDENGNGQLDCEEFCGLIRSLKEEMDLKDFNDMETVKREFQRIDSDCGGQISRQEFFEWWNSVDPTSEYDINNEQEDPDNNEESSIPLASWLPLSSTTSLV